MAATAEELNKLMADFKTDAAQFKLEHDKKMDEMKATYELKMVQMSDQYEQLLCGMKQERMMENDLKNREKKKKKDDSTKLDMLVTKKGFDVIPKFDGKPDKYDDWKFQAGTFIRSEEGFKHLLTWIETFDEMPTEETLYGPDGKVSQCPGLPVGQAHTDTFGALGADGLRLDMEQTLRWPAFAIDSLIGNGDSLLAACLCPALVNRACHPQPHTKKHASLLRELISNSAHF
jgi:hypothetical protein